MLRYLFTAEFIDGTKFVQDQKDQSKLQAGKNVYHDVLQYQADGKKLKTFTLREQKIWSPARIEVDLLTGLITVNGTRMTPEPIEAVPFEFRLIWYMNVKQTMKMEHETATGKFLRQEQLPEQRVFYVGWESEINTHPVRFVIGV